MSSGTQREYENAKDVDLCTACICANGLPCSPCSGFIDLENKITQTEVLLQNLIAQQDKLCTKINSIHEPMIHCLPIEISTHIMELSLSPSWSTSAENEHSKAELYTILYISAVCRTWRQIAMGTPRLWKIIPISLSNKYERHAITLKCVEEWLQRAGHHCPLSLCIYADSNFQYMPRSQSDCGPSWGWDSDNIEEDDDALLSLVSLINRQSYRWQNLQLAVPPKLVRILKGDIHGAPIIKKLSIVPSYSRVNTVWYRIRNHDMFKFSLMGSIKPAPSAVYASGVGRIDIDWHNVTTIELGQVSFNECLVLLRQAVGLIRCALGPVVVGDTNLDKESSVVCPSVQFLRIRGSNSHIMDRFWDLLTIPQLCTLDVTSNSPYHQILGMLDRSSCRLTSLFLEYSSFESGDAQPFELLRRTPHLTELSLVKNDVPWGSGFYHDVNTFCQFLNGQARPPSAPGNTSVEALQDGVKELVLPSLKFLALDNIPILDGPEVQWSGVADLFDDATPHNSLAVSHHNSSRGRPLTTLRISFASDSNDAPHFPFYIDSESVRRFSNIIESGNISLEFFAPDPVRPGGVVDLIARSIEHSGSGISPRQPVVTVDE